MRHLVNVVLCVLLQSLRQYKDQQSETEVLMSALSAMQDKNTHLENSLSAETRIKLDLFKALGEAKRQIDLMKGKCCQGFPPLICVLQKNLLSTAVPSFSSQYNCIRYFWLNN